MFIRALIAFLVLPGIVAIIIPATWLWYSGHNQLKYSLGLVALTIGMIGLFWCVKDFNVAGKGTLAPWAPPEKLVMIGLYRYSRNPMYISVILILIGWAIAFASPALYVYTLVVAITFHVRVVVGEEPLLARKHGSDWEQYITQVPRWFW